MSFSNLIPVLNNAIKANKTHTLVKASKQNLAFLQVLKENKIIYGYSILSKTKVKIFFVYSLKKSPILNLSGISKPSFPIYLSYQDLWKFDKSLATLVLTTSQGIITHKTALSLGIGGQVLVIII